MRLGIALVLLTGGVLLSSADKPTSQDECIKKCKSKCTTTLDSCKQRATSKTAIAACQKSYDICASNCVNKACPPAQGPSK